MLSPEQIAAQKARKYHLPVHTFLTQMKDEAHFQDLTSPAGAQGYAQLMPATAAGMGADPHDPNSAYDAAAHLMRNYIDKYGSERDALVAYNAGPGRVGKALPAETERYLATILGSASGAQNGLKQAPAAGGTGALGTSSSTLDEAGFKDAQRKQLLATFLSRQGSQKNNPLFATGLLSTTAPNPQDYLTAASSAVKSPALVPGSQLTVPGSAPDAFRQIVDRENSIDAQQLPYVWGGGHAAKVKIGPNMSGLDCSGAVSAALGLDPRVASQFMSYGEAGLGKDVTIYAKADHVLMAIRGQDGQWHFWGTSHSNPAGGAGWIPQSAISPQYLKSFTARHPVGL